MRRLFPTLFCICLGLSSVAQDNKIYNENIATLQVVANDNWLSLPIITLNSRDVINIGFDDLTHQYTRYTYTIEHCEADWSVSKGLFPSDYIDGFAEGNTIEDTEESLNTNVMYTHYKLQIPNRKCRLKMSGNYKLTVYDENDNNEPVLTACFMVVEPLMSVQMGMTTNTDIDINNSHQQISMQLSYGNIRVIDPNTQIKTVVMQNGRRDNMRSNVQPQYVMPNGLRWEHCKDLIFQAGNEYYKYEVLDVSHTTMGLESIIWDGEYYNAYPYVNEPRINYIYDEDANGAFYIRNSDNIENDRTCEYVYVHYRLKCPYINNSSVYVNGVWTNNSFTPEYEMTYNEEDKMYEAVILQKQGYYNYQYLTIDDTGMTGFVPYDGNFYQTENKYQALVYYKGQGERTDRLVGYAEIMKR